MAYLTPDVLPEESACRSLLIPDSPAWLAIVSGAINELAQEWNWEKEGSVTTEEAAQAMLSMWMTFVESACSGDCPAQYRINVSGVIEVTTNGEDWTAAEFPPVPAREEATNEDKLCLASKNAVEVLYQTYLGLLDAFNTDSTTQFGVSAFLTLLGLGIAAWFGAPLLAINALIQATLNVFGSAYALMAFLGTDDWTVAYGEGLVCLFLENATLNVDDTVSFDYMAIRDNISELDGVPALKAWTFYIFMVIGSDGLNAAGGTTSIETYDCTDCGVTEWCYEFDFLTDNGLFAPVTVYNVNGTIFCGSASPAPTYTGGIGWSLGRTTGRAFDRVNITHVEADVNVGSGTGAPRFQLYFFDPQGGTSYKTDTGFSALNTNETGARTLQWDGDQMASEMAMMRCTVSGNTVISRLLIRGTGTNPFGEDNCT